MKTFDLRKEFQQIKDLEAKVEDSIKSFKEGDIIVIDDIDGIQHDFTFRGSDGITLFLQEGTEMRYIDLLGR